MTTQPHERNSIGDRRAVLDAVAVLLGEALAADFRANPELTVASPSGHDRSDSAIDERTEREKALEDALFACEDWSEGSAGAR